MKKFNKVYSKLNYLKMISFIFIFLSSCSQSNDSSNKINDNQNNIQRSPIEKSISTYKLGDYFWSFVKKVKRTDNSTIVLQYYKITSKDLLKTKLIEIYDTSVSRELNLFDGEYWLDFDIQTSSNEIIGLIASEQKILDPESGLSLKKLIIRTYSDNNKFKQFDFTDSQRSGAIKYDKSGVKRVSEHFDDTQDLFLTSSPVVDFARIVTDNKNIFLSVFGTIGIKAFAFSYEGQEIWQKDIAPLSDLNTIILDKEAPYITITAEKLATVTEVRSDEKYIFENHFKMKLSWPSEFKSALSIQTMDLLTMKSKFLITQANGNIFPSAISSGRYRDNEILGIVGTIGGAGSRSAFVKIYDFNLNLIFENDFIIQKETSGFALALSNKGFFVAGQYGSSQANTGSVVEPGDAFVVGFNWDGVQIKKSLFGSDRNDSVKTMSIDQKDQIYIGGIQSGPITHTADQDKELGYSQSLFGILNW